MHTRYSLHHHKYSDYLKEKTLSSHASIFLVSIYIKNMETKHQQNVLKCISFVRYIELIISHFFKPVSRSC